MLSALLNAFKDTVDYTRVEERLARVSQPKGEFGVDPFGYDPGYLPIVAWPAYLLYRYYFRVQTSGIENLPTGRCLLIANHSGQLPFDAIMIGATVFDHTEPPRVMRSMVDHFVPTTPFVSYLFPRWGQIVGTPENARLLLDRDELLSVFPEGTRGLNKTFDKRYQLQSFGTGFMRLAMETGAPIVPVAVVGAEEQAPSFYNARGIGKLLGFPAFPITPTNPLIPGLGMLPYPSRYHIRFGEPLVFTGDPNDEDEVIMEPVETVKSTIQSMLDTMVSERDSIFF